MQWLLMVVAMAGAFSPARFVPSLEELGFLIDPRVVFGVPLFSVGLLSFVARNEEARASPKEWLWYGGFFAVHALVLSSYVWAQSPWVAREQMTDLLLLLLFIMTFAQLFAGQLQLAVHMLLVSSVLLSLPFLALSLAVFAASSFDVVSIGFAGGMGGIGMSRLFGLAAIALVFFYLKTGRRLQLLMLPLYAAGIMISGSRAALLALAVALGFLWWRRKAVRPRASGSSLGHLVAILIGGLALAGFFLTPFGFTILEAFVLSNFVGGEAAAGADGIYLADRDIIFQHAARTFLDDPLNGIGVGSYFGPVGEPYPHNLVLLYGVDAGIVPVLILLAFIATFVMHSLTCREDWTVAAATVGIFILVASLFAGSYYDARVFWFMSLTLIIASAGTTRVGTLPGSRLPLKLIRNP